MSARVLAALAALAAALPAKAYLRTCDKTSGACVYWPTPEATWRLNPAMTNPSPSCTPPVVEAAVRASFAAWEGASENGASCTSLKLPFGGTTTSQQTGIGSTGEHIVVFRDGWCSNHVPASDTTCHTQGTCGDLYNCFEDLGVYDRNTLALTTVLYVEATGRIVDADTEIAAVGTSTGTFGTQQPPDGWYFTCSDPAAQPVCTSYGQAGCAFIDLENTITHEAGHFIGLAHPCGDPGQPACTTSQLTVTMAPTAVPRETQKRTLAPDDVAGVCAIYPAFDPGPWSPGTSFQGTHGGGCGAGDAGSLAVLLAAVAALRLRRR